MLREIKQKEVSRSRVHRLDFSVVACDVCNCANAQLIYTRNRVDKQKLKIKVHLNACAPWNTSLIGLLSPGRKLGLSLGKYVCPRFLLSKFPFLACFTHTSELGAKK